MSYRLFISYEDRRLGLTFSIELDKKKILPTLFSILEDNDVHKITLTKIYEDPTNNR